MKNKKILVTGACGFIGSHLTEYLVSKGHKVIAFDKYNRDNHHGWLENSKFKKNIEIILGDIRDYDSVEKSIKGCETVFHLAALCGIPYSYISPLAYIKTNLEGTYNILENSKKKNIENIIITSTSEVYGSANYVPIDEKHPIIGQSPYSASKIAADNLAESYYRSFNLPIKILRPFNTYGPRQSLRAIIPTIINQMIASNKKLTLGNVHPTRDFTYVSDTVDAFYTIFKSKKNIGQTFNFGTNSEISIFNLSKLIGKILKKNFEIASDSKRKRPSKSEVDRLKCNNKKFLKLKNKKFVKLEEGLKKTINFYKLNQKYFINKRKNYHI